MNEKDKIISKYNEFKKISFPNNSRNNLEMQDIFSDLILYDSQIAGAVDKIINNKSIDEKDLVYDVNLEKRISQIPEADPLRNEYLNYMSNIKELINAIKEE
jgi:hypothetical protein